MRLYVLLAPLMMPVVSACMKTTDDQVSQPAPAPVPSTEAAHDAVTDSIPNGTYQGRIGGKNATMTIFDGQPQDYRWGSFSPESLTRSGNEIRVDNATLTLTTIGQDSFTGIWDYRGQQSRVTFRR